jgi:drug/metabolite transporter (DMT)-like permease
MQTDLEHRRPPQHIRLGRGELWALGAALSYALYQVFLRVAVRGDELNDMVGTTVQAIPILLFSVAMSWFVKRRDRGMVSPLSDWKLMGALVANGLLLFVVATPLLFAALRLGGVLITSPLTGTQVLWAALLAAIMLRERLTHTMVLGMVVSVTGIAVLTWGRSGGAELGDRWWLAVPFGLATALCWSLAGVLITYDMRRGVDRFQVLAIPTLVGLAVLNATLLLTGDIGLYASTAVDVLLSLLVAGTFSAVALVCLTTALALTTVASATTLNSIQIALAPLIAWLFLAEELNLVIGLGIALILLGVIVVQRARLATEGEGAEDE